MGQSFGIANVARWDKPKGLHLLSVKTLLFNEEQDFQGSDITLLSLDCDNSPRNDVYSARKQ
jgi:hypothetical protein